MNKLQKWFNIIFKRTPPISDCVRLDTTDDASMETWYHDNDASLNWSSILYSLKDFGDFIKVFKPITQPIKVDEYRPVSFTSAAEFYYSFPNGLILVVGKRNHPWEISLDCRTSSTSPEENKRLNELALKIKEIVDKTVGINCVGWRHNHWSLNETESGATLTFLITVAESGKFVYYRIQYILYKPFEELFED